MPIEADLNLKVNDNGTVRTLDVDDLQTADPAGGPGALDATVAAVSGKLEELRLILAGALNVSAAPVAIGGVVEVANDTGAPLAVTGPVTVSSGNVEVSNDAGDPLAVSGTVEITNDLGSPIPASVAGVATEAKLEELRDQLADAEAARDTDATAAQARLDLLATQATAELAARAGDDFKRLLKFEPVAGEELRAAETATDRYHGMAPDTTATSAAAWKVVRFYKDGSGAIERVRFRTGVVWDDRGAGW